MTPPKNIKTWPSVVYSGLLSRASELVKSESARKIVLSRSVMRPWITVCFFKPLWRIFYITLSSFERPLAQWCSLRTSNRKVVGSSVWSTRLFSLFPLVNIRTSNRTILLRSTRIFPSLSHPRQNTSLVVFIYVSHCNDSILLYETDLCGTSAMGKLRTVQTLQWQSPSMNLI